MAGGVKRPKRRISYLVSRISREGSDEIRFTSDGRRYRATRYEERRTGPGGASSGQHRRVSVWYDEGIQAFGIWLMAYSLWPDKEQRPGRVKRPKRRISYLVKRLRSEAGSGAQERISSESLRDTRCEIPFDGLRVVSLSLDRTQDLELVERSNHERRLLRETSDERRFRAAKEG